MKLITHVVGNSGITHENQSGSRIRDSGVSKIVRTVGIEWKVGSKEGRIKARLSVVEERLLLDRRD
jgi:hypothetical protein